MKTSNLQPSFTLECLSNSADLKVLFNRIIGFSQQMLDTQEDLSASHQEQLNAIHNDGKQLLYHFNSLLDAAKIETGKLKPQIEKVDLASIVETITTVSLELLSEQRITVEKEVPEKLPLVLGEKHRLAEIMFESIRFLATTFPRVNELTHLTQRRI